MVKRISREVKILALAFFFIFFGFNAVQQFVTSYFSDIGMAELGFQSLILVYLFFAVFDPLSAVFVSRYGARKCMIIAAIFYTTFIISLLTKSSIIIYIASSLLGIAASLLWTGQNSYLIRASDKKNYGASSGFFNSMQSFGSVLGVFIVGFVIAVFFFGSAFLFFSVFPLIGLMLMFKIKDIRTGKKLDHIRLMKKSITSMTAIRLSAIYFSFMFVYGLVIGIIPVEIKNIAGLAYVGIISSLFYLLPIIFSYAFGRLSDIKGRKAMIILSYLICITGLLVLYFSHDVIMLLIGIVMLALNYSIIRPVTFALVGDVSTKDNLEFLTALFWMSQSIGVVSALIISDIFRTKLVYLISIAVIFITLLILLPLLKLSVEKLKERISKEV